MTSHKDMDTEVSICKGTPSVLHECRVDCSGLEVDRKYDCVKEHLVSQAGFMRLILILSHTYKEASSRHDVLKL